MDIWNTDSGGGGTATPGLHLHHHGGLSGLLHFPNLRRLLQISQRCLLQVVEN